MEPPPPPEAPRPPPEEVGFCCLHGEVFPAPHMVCAEERGAFFPDAESAARECGLEHSGPPPDEPGFCCVHGEVFPAPQRVCAGEGGAFSPDPESAEHECGLQHSGAPEDEPGFCCLHGEVFPAPHQVCAGEGGAFFPDPESASGECALFHEPPEHRVEPPPPTVPRPQRAAPEAPPHVAPPIGPLATVRVVNEWVKTGGPIGGLGYDVRYGGADTQLLYVTDNYSGVNRSVDGGTTWSASNQGIRARTGHSGDAIPVFSLTVDPNDPRIVWAGMKGVLGIYKSTDRGQTWFETTPAFLEGKEVVFRGFTVEPGNSRVVYAAAEIPTHDPGRGFDRVRGAIYRTEDGGGSWKTLWEGKNLARYVIVHPDDPGVLYASLGIFDREAKDSACKDVGAVKPGDRGFHAAHGSGGVLKSTDRGASWTALGPAQGLTDLYVGSLVMHPTNPKVLLAGAGNNACSVFHEGGKPRFTGGVFLTVDGGSRWSHTLADDIVTSVEFSPSSPRIAYAGSRRRIYASRDGGESWSVVAGHTYAWGPPGVIAGFPIDFLVDLRRPTTLFANNYGGGNVKSTDGGVTWSLASQGYTGALMHSLALHPKNPDIVYAGARSGLFRSLTGGRSWEGLSHPPAALAEAYSVAIKPDEPNVVLASQEHLGTLYRSTDGGLAWKAVAKLPVQPGTSKGEHGFKRIVFTHNPMHVYAGSATKSNKLDTYPTSHGIWKSENGGVTWKKLSDPKIADVAVNDLAVDPKDFRVAYAATAAHGIFKTRNGGTTWEALTTHRGSAAFPKDVRSIAVRPDRPSTVYAGTQRGGVYASTDGGTNWSFLASGMQPNDPIWSLVVDPAHPDVVWAGSHRTGVYRWDSIEQQWVHFNRGLRTRAVVDLAISGDGLVLYATTTGEGVFRLQLTPR